MELVKRLDRIRKYKTVIGTMLGLIVLVLAAGLLTHDADHTELEPLPAAARPTVTPTKAIQRTIVYQVITNTPAATPVVINDVPLASLMQIPPQTRQNIREIYARGQELGRDPHAFSKLGDSTIENPHFLARYDTGPYDLGAYDRLQPMIDYFNGSFSRYSVAVRRGLHSWSVFDPMWADPAQCLPQETMLACEFRLHNPAMLFIRLGSNDRGVPDSFERSLRQVIEYSIERGVIPLLGTKADRQEGAGNTNNEIIRRLAAEYNVPLWDYDLLAGTLPGRGLDADGVHMTTYFAHDYSSPVAFRRGYGLHNLLALMILDAVWQEVTR